MHGWIDEQQRLLPDSRTCAAHVSARPVAAAKTAGLRYWHRTPLRFNPHQRAPSHGIALKRHKKKEENEQTKTRGRVAVPFKSFRQPAPSWTVRWWNAQCVTRAACENGTDGNDIVCVRLWDYHDRCHCQRVTRIDAGYGFCCRRRVIISESFLFLHAETRNTDFEKSGSSTVTVVKQRFRDNFFACSVSQLLDVVCLQGIDTWN